MGQCYSDKKVDLKKNTSSKMAKVPQVAAVLGVNFKPCLLK